MEPFGVCSGSYYKVCPDHLVGGPRMDPATPTPGLDQIEPQPPHGALRGHWMDLGQGGLQTSMETQNHTGSCKAKKNGSWPPSWLWPRSQAMAASQGRQPHTTLPLASHPWQAFPGIHMVVVQSWLEPFPMMRNSLLFDTCD